MMIEAGRWSFMAWRRRGSDAAPPSRRTQSRFAPCVILFLHQRYRTVGGEERVVADLRRLVEERLDEPTSLYERDSAGLPRRRAATGLVRGGLHPDAVGDAVRYHGARIVHAHNVHPTLGWRA